jgi:hypothetical protein
MNQWQHFQREWGTSVQPLKKPTVPTVLVDRQFMDKNKQLTLLNQCKLVFTVRNVLMALKIQRDIKKIKIKPGATLILA